MAKKEPVFGSKLPLKMLEDLLAHVRAEFYAGKDAAFFSERKQLLKAITYPAAYLEKRNGLPTPERYEEIFRKEIVAPLKKHSKYVPLRGSYWCAYFYQCVQHHIAKHWETYYEESKAIQRQVADVLHGLLKIKSEQPAPEQRMSALVEVHRAVSSKGGRKKAEPANSQIQPELF